MLEWLYRDGRSESPIHRASFVLWKINAIHPFNGGNGRVARALAYLVVIIDVAPLFAGEPLPMKLKARKSEYIEALKAADREDLKPLEQLVLACIQAQFPKLPAVHGRILIRIIRFPNRVQEPRRRATRKRCIAVLAMPAERDALSAPIMSAQKTWICPGTTG